MGMKKDKQTLAVITARGGSKGIPKKNVKMLFGKPLIAYSIQAAQKSKTLNKVIVSTDDKTIANVSKQYGADVPFLRPKYLASDTATSLSVLQHAVRYLEEKEQFRADMIVCLQPTSPLRSAHDIDQAVTLCSSSGADSVVSLCQVDYHPYWMKRVVAGRVYPLIEMEDENKYPRRQDLPPVYQLNGAICVTRRKTLLEEERVLGKNTLAYIMPPERSIDIDTTIDLKLAELILKGEVAP